MTYVSLNNPERRQLEEAMRIIRRNNGNADEYLSARRTALEIAHQFYNNPETQKEMGEVYREIGDSILARESEESKPGFLKRLFGI
jgi:hypothetical protein